MTSVETHIGRHEIQRDIADARRVARLAALLDHDEPLWKPGVLPPLGHWICFQPDARQSMLGPDGHPRPTPNGLLPDVDLPRRMWAGSRVEFLRDIPLDASISRISTIIAATPKQGSSGPMLFVTVRHEIFHGDSPSIIEEQDIVYRGTVTAAAENPDKAAAGAPRGIVRTVMPEAEMLFRYSALTFNAHRIHYDRTYSREVEGYPGLVVQGPLVATLLIDHLLRQQPASRIAAFRFRATGPLYEGQQIQLTIEESGREAKLYATGPNGVAATAAATFAQ